MLVAIDQEEICPIVIMTIRRMEGREGEDDVPWKYRALLDVCRRVDRGETP